MPEILLLGPLQRDLPAEVWRGCLASLRSRFPAAGPVLVNANGLLRDSGAVDRFLEILFESGIDVVTLGDQAVARTAARRALDRWPRLLRPLNLPPGAPGTGAVSIPTPSGPLWFVSLFTGTDRFPVDDPFAAFERFVRDCQPPAVVVDVAGPDLEVKKALSWRWQGGNVPVHVVGTGLGVATDDLRVTGGRAFVSDLGMIGDPDLIDGRSPADWWSDRHHLPRPAADAPPPGYLRIDGARLVTGDGFRAQAFEPFRMRYPA
ncbi:MAG: hypothetical protein GX442_05635 [Candidatus Riflebacteria bacterium]|nr:hypothetical protein [Candidatus Riflebacteria bacterium]